MTQVTVEELDDTREEVEDQVSSSLTVSMGNIELVSRVPAS